MSLRESFLGLNLHFFEKGCDNCRDNLFIEFCFDLLSYYTSKFYEIKDLDLKRYHQVCGNLMLYQYINNSNQTYNDKLGIYNKRIK